MQTEYTGKVVIKYGTAASSAAICSNKAPINVRYFGVKNVGANDKKVV